MDKKITIQDLEANYVHTLINSMKENTIPQNWILSERLSKMVNSEAKKKRRFIYNELQDFLRTPTSDICAIYGLRRTGKTVLMKQAISDLLAEGVCISSISYITFAKNTDYTDDRLLMEIDKLINLGVKYFFIDEISFVKMDLEDNCLNKLSDEYGSQGIKIVIAGTFSYALKLLSDDVLFDRIFRIDTTYFSYKEASEVFGLSMDKFIEYGGIIIGDNESKITPREYMKTAIVDNVVNSILKSNKLYDIGYLDKEIDAMINDADKKRISQRLSATIHRVIDQYMKTLIYNNITRTPYKFSDVGNLADIIRQRSQREHIQDGLLSEINIDKKAYYGILEKNLGDIKDTRMNAEIFKAFIDILKQLGVIEDIYLQGTTVSCFITNYIRYGLCDEIITQIAEDIKKETQDRFSSDLAVDVLKGHMQEAIIYLDLKHSNNYDFDMYRNADGTEVDLVIKDNSKKEMDVYEIKHSTEFVEEQAKNLVNSDFILEMERELGYKVRTLNVIYNGIECDKEIDAIELFQKIAENSRMLNKREKQLKYEQYAKREKVLNKGKQIVHYINVEQFLKTL